MDLGGWKGKGQKHALYKVGLKWFYETAEGWNKTLQGPVYHVINHCGGKITHFKFYIEDIFLKIYYGILTTNVLS